MIRKLMFYAVCSQGLGFCLLWCNFFLSLVVSRELFIQVGVAGLGFISVGSGALGLLTATDIVKGTLWNNT